MYTEIDDISKRVEVLLTKLQKEVSARIQYVILNSYGQTKLIFISIYFGIQ